MEKLPKHYDFSDELAKLEDWKEALRMKEKEKLKEKENDSEKSC